MYMYLCAGDPAVRSNVERSENKDHLFILLVDLNGDFNDRRILQTLQNPILAIVYDPPH